MRGFHQFTSLEVQQGSNSTSSASHIISPEQNDALDFNSFEFSKGYANTKHKLSQHQLENPTYCGNSILLK